MKKSVLLAFLFLSLFHFSFSADIVINEIVASNSESFTDEDFATPDWIEIYNRGTADINLKDYRISDRDSMESAWVFPDTVIRAGGYMLVCASGKDRTESPATIVMGAGEGLYWNAQKDGCRFYYLEVTGDFDMRMQVHSFKGMTHFGGAGIILRESLDPGSRFAGYFTSHSDWAGYFFSSRTEENVNSEWRFSYWRPNKYPDVYMRLGRKGDTIYSATWDEGWYWRPADSIYFPANEKVYAGYCFSSGYKDYLTKFAVSRTELNGTPVSLWDMELEEIRTEKEGRHYTSVELHSDFKLQREGETVYLWNPSGQMIDSLEYPEQSTDISYGRCGDGNDNFMLMFPSSPDYPNGNCFDGMTPAVGFSPDGAWTAGPVEVILSCADKDAAIYYSLDGSGPSDTSKKYDKPFTLNNTTVVRAIAIKEGQLNSQVVARTFFVNERDPGLNIFSLSVDPYNLYDKSNGIFHPDNLFKGMEAPLQFEYFRKRIRVYEAMCGAKAHGQISRGFPQKSIRLFARSKYGNSSFDYPFFNDLSYDTFEKLLLRNGGSDWWKTLLRDGFIGLLLRNLPTLNASKYDACVVYLNGEYYGIENLRERVDEDFIAFKYDVPVETVNFMEDWDILKNGSSKSYYEMYNSIMNSDINTPEAYRLIDSTIDIDNFLKYTSTQVYTANFDWPWKNLKYWQSDEYDKKWRWIINDMDYSYGMSIATYYTNNFFIAFDSTRSFGKLFKTLMDNESIRNQWFNYTADLLNTEFHPLLAMQLIDSLSARIEGEIPYQREKWGDTTAQDWDRYISQMREFAEKRPGYLRDTILAEFGLPGKSNLTLDVNDPKGGKIKISSLLIDEFPWDGIYFKGVPITIEAVPNKGYVFKRWTRPELSDSSARITVLLEDVYNIGAVFEAPGSSEGGIVINEIMYRPADDHDCKDWIELYNNSDGSLDISSWSLSDDNDEHLYYIPDNTIIDTDQYLVIARSPEDFEEWYPEVENFIGPVDYGFGRNDQVRLFDSDNELVDIVEYDSDSPWPDNADGTGRSIELTHPDRDNALPSSWKASLTSWGTPGEENSTLTDVGGIYSSHFGNASVYPNPADESVTFELEGCGSISNFAIVNSTGTVQSIKDLAQQLSESGCRVTIKTSDLPSGVYFFRAMIDGDIVVVPINVLH